MEILLFTELPAPQKIGFNGTDTCEYEGATYNHGQFISNKDRCEDCYCLNSTTVCSPVQCEETPAGCTVLERNECCATKYLCGEQFNLHLLKINIKRLCLFNMSDMIEIFF